MHSINSQEFEVNLVQTYSHRRYYNRFALNGTDKFKA